MKIYQKRESDKEERHEGRIKQRKEGEGSKKGKEDKEKFKRSRKIR